MPLTEAQFDGNTYEFATAIADLIANPPTADSVVSVSQSGLNLTFHTTLGNSLGPVVMPVVQFRWRGTWTPLTLYDALDAFKVDGEGIFSVNVDHTSAATFDAAAIGGSPPEALYNQLIGVGTNSSLDDLNDVSVPSPVSGQVLRYVGGSPDSVWQADTLTLDDISDVDAPAPSIGQVLTWTGSPASWQPAAVATTLDGLTDVIAPTPLAGQVLRYLGGSPDALWQPDTLTLDDLGDVSAAAPGDGYVLTYQAGSPTGWIAAAPASVPSTLDSLTDVTAPTPADGDFLQYDTGSPAGWKNQAGTAISSLGAATLPISAASLLEVSEATGSPVTYASKQITVANLLAVGNITGLGTGVATALAINVGSAGAFVTFNGALGTPSSGTLTNATGLPISTGVSGLGANVATFLGTPSSANLAAAVTDETGSGALVFAASPILASPNARLSSSGTTLNAAGGNFIVQNSDGTANNWTRFQALDSSGASIAIIGIQITDHTNHVGDIILAPRISGGGNPLERLRVYNQGDTRIGTGGALGTTDTSGFLLISTCAGVPTGVPTNAGAGQIPIIYDKTNNKLYAYNGGWKASGVFA